MDLKQAHDTVVIATGDERREMVREALTVLGDTFTEKARSAKKIFVHPNLVTHNNAGATADTETVRGVIDHIALLRGDVIVIGDAGFRDTKKAFENYDFESLKRSGNIELVDLNDDETVESYAYTKKFEKRPIGFSKTVVESDVNIVVVPAKMHTYTTVSLSVKTHTIGSQVVRKTPFGIYARWPWNHTGYRQIHKTMADVYAEHPAQCAIIDGTRAMEGDGPASGRNVDLGWIIASMNPVAADALAVFLLGLSPRDIGYLVFLDEKGLGPIDIEKMHIEGPDPFSLRREVERPSSYPGVLEWRSEGE